MSGTQCRTEKVSTHLSLSLCRNESKTVAAVQRMDFDAGQVRHSSP